MRRVRMRRVRVMRMVRVVRVMRVVRMVPVRAVAVSAAAVHGICSFRQAPQRWFIKGVIIVLVVGVRRFGTLV